MKLRAIALRAMVAVAMLLVIPAAANAATPVLTLTVTVGPPTTASVANGSMYPKKDAITVTFDGATVATAMTGGNGKFSAAFTVPATATPGTHTVSAFDPAGLGASATFTVRTNWSNARFDPPGTGDNVYENVISAQNASSLVDAESPQWGAFLDSEPTYAGGMVFVGSDDGTVRAFNPATGQQTWLYDLKDPGPVGSPVAVQRDPGPGSCAVVAGTENGTLDALDPLSGQLLWSFKDPGPAGTPVALPPVLRKGVGTPHGLEFPIVEAFGDGSVDRLNGCTGTVDWGDAPLGPGPTQTPAFLSGVQFPDGTTHDIILVAFSDGTIDALDSGTGAVLWSQKDPGPPNAPSAFGSGTAGRIVLGSGTSVMELDAATGAMLWMTDTGAMVEGGVAIQAMLSQGTGSPTPTAVERLITGNANGDVLALDPTTGAILWKDPGPGQAPTPITTPAMANGLVHVERDPGPSGTGLDGMLLVLDASTGAQLFSADLGSRDPGPVGGPSPAVADGKIFTGDFTGGLRVFALP